jgi:hypothetical protein
MLKSIKTRIGLSAAASAIALMAIAGTTLAGPLTPHDGDCKQITQVSAVANSPDAARQVWIAMITNKFGPKWAHWVGAKDKAVVPANGGFFATAKPCFYQPVL